jgi:hypothetical protein
MSEFLELAKLCQLDRDRDLTPEEVKMLADIARYELQEYHSEVMWLLRLGANNNDRRGGQ